MAEYKDAESTTMNHKPVKNFSEYLSGNRNTRVNRKATDGKRKRKKERKEKKIGKKRWEMCEF